MFDIIFVFAAVATILLYPKIEDALFDMDFRTTWHDWRMIIALTALLVATLYSPLASRMLSGKVMRFFGNISYSIYLLHLPIMYLFVPLHREMRQPELMFPLFMGAVILIGWMSYTLFERPLRDWINGYSFRKFSQRPTGTQERA